MMIFQAVDLHAVGRGGGRTAVRFVSALNLVRNFVAMLSLLSVGVVGLWGQTNTFPDSGNAGIGTTSPQTQIQIAHFASHTETLGSANNPALRISNTDSAALGEKAEIQFAVGGGSTVTSAITASYSDWASPGGSYVGSDLLFSTKPAQGSLTERMRIDKNGNVGIGTSDPNAKLAVYAGNLGYNLGDTLPLFSLHNVNDNQSYFNISQVRTTAGNRWYGATTRLQVVTDTTPQGYIDFNPLDGDYGLAFGSQGNEYMRIQNGGNVGIGTSNPTNKLEVNGTIRAKEVIVEANNWPDYVFAKSAPQPSLAAWKKSIDASGHLPDMPSKAQAEKGGVGVGQMQKALLKQVEEMTLVMIKQQKTIDELKAEVEMLKNRSNNTN